MTSTLRVVALAFHCALLGTALYIAHGERRSNKLAAAKMAAKA